MTDTFVALAFFLFSFYFLLTFLCTSSSSTHKCIKRKKVEVWWWELDLNQYEKNLFIQYFFLSFTSSSRSPLTQRTTWNDLCNINLGIQSSNLSTQINITQLARTAFNLSPYDERSCAKKFCWCAQWNILKFLLFYIYSQLPLPRKSMYIIAISLSFLLNTSSCWGENRSKGKLIVAVIIWSICNHKGR